MKIETILREKNTIWPKLATFTFECVVSYLGEYTYKKWFKLLSVSIIIFYIISKYLILIIHSHLGCNSYPQSQVEPLELCDVLPVGVHQVHPETALHHLVEGPQHMDERKTIQENFHWLFLKFLL